MLSAAVVIDTLKVILAYITWCNVVESYIQVSINEHGHSSK